MNKETVEKLLRERGVPDNEDIIWRDSRKSTYQGIYDYLREHPDIRYDDTLRIWSE